MHMVVRIYDRVVCISYLVVLDARYRYSNEEVYTILVFSNIIIDVTHLNVLRCFIENIFVSSVLFFCMSR